jgi:hypothetical protein
MVVPAWASAAAGRAVLREDGGWVAGPALPILDTHQTEECAWPGGFCPSVTSSCSAATGRIGR